MAFPREDDVTKDTVQDFQIVFFVPGPDNVDGVQSGEIDVQILLSSGQSFNRQYNLLVRLGDDAPGLVHLSNLADLRDYIRTRLENEVLP
jgi:hypothetical protein